MEQVLLRFGMLVADLCCFLGTRRESQDNRSIDFDSWIVCYIVYFFHYVVSGSCISSVCMGQGIPTDESYSRTKHTVKVVIL
jgi:hypothetical protein